jgi:hypothetical protein
VRSPARGASLAIRSASSRRTSGARREIRRTSPRWTSATTSITAASPQPKSVASGFCTRLVTHATITSTDVAIPTTNQGPVRPSLMLTRSTAVEESTNAPSRPNA